MRNRTMTLVRLAIVAILICVGLMDIKPHAVSAAGSIHYLYGSGSATGGKRVNFRIELTDPAPAGGATVTLSSSDNSIPVPSTVTVPAGQTEKSVGVTTVPVTSNTSVIVSATYGGITKSRVVVIKEPFLSSLSVQSVIRAGGNGKVVVRLSGRAPSGGVVVRVTSNRPSILTLPGDVTIDAGHASATLIVPAADVTHDTPANVVALSDGIRIVKGTVVRKLSSPMPTPTPSQTAEPTGEPTQVVTEEPTMNPTEVVTQSPTEESTQVPTEEATTSPTEVVTAEPTEQSTEIPTEAATELPTEMPTEVPTQEPTVETTVTPI